MNVLAPYFDPYFIMATPSVLQIIEKAIMPSWTIKSQELMEQIHQALRDDPVYHDYWYNSWNEPIYDDWGDRRRLDLMKEYQHFKTHPLFQYTPVYITLYGGYYIRRQCGVNWWAVDYYREIYVAVERKPVHILDVKECTWAFVFEN